MRHYALVFALLVSTAGYAHADIITLDDIQNWSGTGSNRAGFVIDWKDGSTPLAWGFRWDGTATGESMLRAIAASPDSGVRAHLANFGSFGYGVYGLGYDENRNGVFNTDPGLVFVNGVDQTSSPNDLRIVTDVGDRFQEGWFSAGYWSYWTKPDATSDWTSDFGMTGRTLTDGAWDGWSFAPGFVDSAPGMATAAPAAVPEPGPLVLVSLAVGVIALAARARSRKAAVA